MSDFMSIYYAESRYGGFTDVDGTIAFYFRITSLINSSSVVLDFGCGRGICDKDPLQIRRELKIFKGRCKKVIGIDIDETARNNPFIDEFHLLKNNRVPLGDRSVDMCVCDSVLEHVENPNYLFSECGRVIKQGGYLCIRTPNIYGYVGLFSRLVPNRLHYEVLMKLTNLRRKEEDVFRTFYECNSIKKIRGMLETHGFEHCVYGYEAEPTYLQFSRLCYMLGVLYQRFAPSKFKNTIFAFAKKK